MWELVKRSLQRERTMTAAQLGRPRRASVQRMHNEIVEAFLKAGRQRMRRSATGRLGSVDSVVGDGVGGRVPRSVRGGLWRAFSSLGLAIAMAIRLLNPCVLISVALGQRQSLLAHLSARVDSMRAVLSPRIGRRRRLTAWVQDTLPQRRVSEAASAVWQDGSLLCGIVEAAVPGSCPGYDSLTPPNADRGATLWLGQKLASRYLGVPPAFSDEEFSIPHLTIHMERRMLRYLSALKTASARVEAERRRRQAALESSGASVLQEDAFSLDTIANSSLPPGESLLECVARGMGLILGVQGRKSTFYLYLNPNHPHRHIHRLMRSSTLERQPSFDDEAGAILMQIRGPEGDFGATLLSTAPGSSSTTLGTSLEIMNENWFGRIPIRYETTEESVMVSYVPQTSGRHELILLQRGGSHVPGSPFSITVEDSSEVPDDNGKLRRFGSEPVDGLLPPPKYLMTKATSYESGLDKGHRRIGSGGSDPGTRSEGDYPGETLGVGKRRRVVARVVDFVTEKMLLTEDGKLERLPKRRKVVGRQERSGEKMGLLSEDDETRDVSSGRRYSTLYTSLSRVKHLEVDEPIHGTYPGRRSPVDFGKSETTYGISKSGLEMDTVSGGYSSRVYKGKRRGSEKLVRVSEIASQGEKESLDSINFREHCRRILWLCDILLKHSPRQESLEILNTAGDILDGKRVHPTIMEESEPEDTSNATSPQSVTMPPPAEPRGSIQSSTPQAHELRVAVSPPATKSLAQRLQREPSDTGGLNEVSAWKDGRRQFHSWTRKEKDGGGIVGGRLIHKGGSYRGVVVRDMTPEALSGAYTGGDELTEDEVSQKIGFDDEDLTEEDFPFDAASGMARHSLPKIRPPSLGKQMECRRASVETPEQRSSASDRGTDGGSALAIGKRLNKSNASDVRGQINCSGRGLGPACGAIMEKDRMTGVKVSTLRSGGGTEDHQRSHSKKEDKSSSSVARKNIVLAAAVALAEGEIKGLEEEPWEKPLSDIGTAAIPAKEEKNEKCDKEIMDPLSKGEPPPVQGHKEGKEEFHEGAGGEDAVACGVQDEEEQEKQESGEPPTVESESLRAREINEHSPTPSGEMPPRTLSPPIRNASAEQSPGCREEEVTRISREKTGGETTESEHPQTTSKKDEKKEESVAAREVEEKKRENEGGECERHERVDKCVEIKTDENKREEQIVNNEGFDVVKSDDERIHPEPPGVQKEEADQMKKIDFEFCEEEKDRDREGSRMQTESEIRRVLEEGNNQKSLLATKETLNLEDDNNVNNVEEIGAVVKEEIKENVETYGQGKGKREEKSLSEMEKGKENGENSSETFVKEKKEIEIIEESLRVMEDESQKSLGSESNVLEDAKLQEKSENLEKTRGNFQERNITHDSDDRGRNETERFEISVSEGDDQLVVMTEETYSVKETVVGNEDQLLQSEMDIAEESGRTEIQPELETDVTKADREENEEATVEKVDIHKIVDGESYEPSETRIIENGGKLREGQENNQHLIDHNEHYLMPGEGTEAEKLVSEIYQNENILRDDCGISLSEKEKRDKDSDACKTKDEKIATAETEVDEITQAGENSRGKADAIGDRSSTKRGESSKQAEAMKEIERSEDANPNVFSVDQEKKFMIGSFHEVLKLEDAFFTSAIGIQNTKECGNAHVIPGDTDRSLPCKDEGAEEKIDENVVKIELQVGQEKGETNKGLEGTALIKEKPSEETEPSETIKKCEHETKDELALGFEGTSEGKVGANNLKGCSEINDADKKPLQMQENKEATILCPKNENYVVGNNSSSEFSKFDSTLIKEPKDYFNAFVEETQTLGKGDTDIRFSTGVEIEDFKVYDDAKGKKDDALLEIEETRSLSSKYQDISRKVMNEIVSKDCEKSKGEETLDTKEETMPKVEIASKTLISSSCIEEFMGNVKEIAKIDSEKEKSASEKIVTHGGEVRLKEVVETEVEAVIRPNDDIVTASNNRVKDNRCEGGNIELIGQSNEILEDEKIEVTLNDENQALDFGNYQTKNMMAEEGDQFRHDDILLGNSSKSRHKNKDMENGRVVEGNIHLDNITENTLHKKNWDGEEVEVKCEETAFEKILNPNKSVQRKGREHEDESGHAIARDNSPQSLNKTDSEQNIAETREVREDAADVKEKDSMQTCSAQMDDNRKSVDEKPQGRKITDEDMGKMSSTNNVINDHKEQAKLYVSTEEQPPKGEEIFKQLYPDMKDEQVTDIDGTKYLNEISGDEVRATESNAKTDEGKETVRKGTEELGKSLEIKSLEIQTMMESVKTAILERTAVDSLIDFDIQTCEYTQGKVEMSVEKSAKISFNERKEAEEYKFTETNPFAEFNEMNEPEKGPTESFHENDTADGVKECKLGTGETHSVAGGAEEAEVRKDEKGGHEIEDVQKVNDEEGGGAPLGEGTQKEEEEPSKEEAARLNEEESKENQTGAEAKTPTYGEIVGRILCTDSFPSESLEWFEEEGKKGEAVEGTLESMVESGGGAEAVEAGTAVGDEVWELPETTREDEQSPDIAEAERDEGLRTHREGEEEGMEKICEETIEGAEIEDDDQWTSGTQSNLEEDEEDAGQEGTMRGGGGPSLRVGVGVVVAGGIVSRDSSRRDSSEGRDAAWRRSKWRASRSKSIEEGLPLPKADPVGKEWEEICMGIDAMEDGSISQVIAEVSGKRRRRRTRKERGDRSGKAMRTGYGRWARDGTEATKEPPIPESQTPEEEAAEAQRLTQLPAKVGVGLTTSAGVIAEEEEKKEEMETSEGTGASREESPRVGMFGDPRWYSSSSWSSSLGGAKVEELRVDWVGAMEEGKRGRGPAEEEGVEAREEAGVEEVSERAEEGEGSTTFPGDKSVSFTEMTPAEVSRVKGPSAKDFEVPVATSNRGIRLEEMVGGKGRGEKTDMEAIEERKSSHVHDASPNNDEGLREADKEKEGKAQKRRNAENFEVTNEKIIREGDEEGEEMEEEEEEEVGVKVTDEVVSSHVTGEDLKETAGVESDNTELGNIPTGEESEENQWDGERRNSKSMNPPEDDVSSKFENKYSQEEKETIFGQMGSNKGKLTEAQSSGEWEFIDTGRHFAGNENSEEETFNESDGRYPRDNFDGDSKGSFFHSLVGNRDSNQSLGVVGMGIELLHSLVDIPNGEETVSTDGASPKREGEELFGVRMTLDDWDRGRGPNYAGSKAEVVVGELDLLDDWDHGVGRIGFIEIATDEHQRNDLKDDHGMKIIGMEKENFVEETGEKDGDQTEISYLEGKSESTIIFTEKKVIAEESESDVKQEKRGEDENHESTDDDDIEEIVRTEADDWSRGTFTFTDSDHRSAFRNFEDLLGGDVSFRMTTCTSQFNLWPSEEAFGGKGTWMEHIDMDAFMSTAQSQQKPCSGKGLLEGMTTFAKTCVVGDEKGSTTTREQYYFTNDGEGGEKRKEILADGDEDDVVLVEQDFDDRSDEIEDNVGSASPWKSTYQSFDFSHMSNVSKGDAFAIFESPGVTTRATQDYEQPSDDEIADDDSSKNRSRATLSGSEEMEMLDLSGDWEESVVFIDDDDDDGKNIPIGGRRGSGEYRKFENEVEGRVDTDLWGPMTLSNVDSCAGDTAFAIVMNSEEMKEKTPVLPTGRWCPRLPLLSPAMSAISEEESEEIYPDKYEKQDEESGSFQTDNEWDNQSSLEKAITREAEDENLPENTVLWEPSSESEGCGSGLENVTGGNEIQPSAINLTPDETDTRSSHAENLEQDDAKHQLPKLDVEVEDGFGEPFSRRRSSSSSVLSETTTAEPMADCGAAFVVSSELAVALALGVSITQIIPPTMDQPEPPPLPQVELGTDALRAGHAREKERLEVCKSSISSTMSHTHAAQSNLSDEEQRTCTNESVNTASDNSISPKGIQSSTVSTKENNLGSGKENNLGRKDDVDFLFPERNVSWYNEDEEEIVDWWRNQRLMTDTFSVKEEVVDDKTELVNQEQPSESDKEKENNISVPNSINFLYPERNVSWYNDDEEEVIYWCYKEKMAAVKLSGKEETGHEKVEPTLVPTTDIKEENYLAEKESIDFLFPERNVNWYDDDQEEEHDNWSYWRPQAGTVVEEEKKEVKTTEEEKIIAFLDKERDKEKELSAAPDEEVSAESRKKRRPLESKGKSSPPSGARKKESPDKKTRDSPARPIPLEKLLGWSSENGNGINGIGCSGTASRRESVFDDYNFSLWENEFKLNRNGDTGRGSKRQDSTGLEYYLDVDQLLNVPLAATEPEVKYVSAKEIMDTFSREMDSPEKSSDKESESKGKKASKSDSLDDSLLGAVGGATIAPVDEGLVEEATGSSQTVIETKNKGQDLWADDLFTDAFQSKARIGSKIEPINSPWVFTGQRPMKSIASLEEHCKAAMPVSKPEEDIIFENMSCVKAEETCTIGNEIEEFKKDAVVSAGMGDGIEIKSTDGESAGDQKQYGAISKRSCEADTKNRRFSSGGKVRNMIGIFEQQPGVTKSPTRKELASHKDGEIEKRGESVSQEIRSDDIKCVYGKLGDTEEENVRLEIQEPIKMLSEETLQDTTTLEMSRSVDNSAGKIGLAEAEAMRSAQLESSSIGKVTESAVAEHRKVQKEQLIDIEEAQRTENRPPTLEDKRDDILSLTEEPVVGWEAIKVATEVENIILSTGNSVEQKRNVMGEVIILAESDKKSGATGAHAKKGANASETEIRRKEVGRVSSTKVNESTERGEEHLPEGCIDRSERKEEPLTSRMERMSTSSSFEEYKSVVSEAYQFLEALGDTIDEDDEEKEALPGEEAKETGGKAEESVGGLGSEVEEYHPCEELPGGERETIPRGVEGAPTKGGQAEAQSSPSSPERCKTTESSTSSSPYSSLPTFADISSGILSSASSKDENSLKTEDGPSRRDRTTHKTQDNRGSPKAEADGTTDRIPVGDILEEEMDSTTLAKMNVASRKEYWDRRLQRAQEKSKEPVTVGSKPSPLTLSGIVARGRMSFEKSKDEYSTSDSGGDGGKSSSESSPTSKGNQFSRRPKAVYSKGARSILPPKPVGKEPLELTLSSEEKEAPRPMEEQSSGSVDRVSNQDIPKEIRIPSGQEKAESSKHLDDKEDLSQISVSKRREIWNQKVQKIPEDDSPPSSIEYRRTERRKSSKLESKETISGETPLRRRSDVPPYTRELEEQSLSLDSSSVDDRVGKDLGIKKPPTIKTGGSVSQLAKLFSSPPPEPPPVKSRGIRPMSKLKYSRGPEAGSLSSKDESIDEPRGSAESSSSAASPKAKAIVKTATVEASITGSRSPSPGESLAKKITSVDKNGKKFSEDLRKTSYSPTSKSPRSVVDGSTFRTDSESSEIDNIASRRQKYLESVQQSLEGDDGRHEGTLKKSESEDSMKERMRKNAVSDVRNIWEKRASLDGSSSSESMKRPGKGGTILRSPISNKKKVTQEERLAAMTSVGRPERVHATPLKVASTVTGTDGKVDISQEMSVAQNKMASSAVPPSVAKEKGHKEGDNSTHISQFRRKEGPMDAEKDCEPQIPLSTESAGGVVAGLSVQSSVVLHEERPLKNEGKQVQGEQTTSQLMQAKIENKIDSHDLSSENMAQGSDQSGNLVARVETASEIKFVARESTPQEKPKSPYGRGFTQQREGPASTEAKVPGDSTAQSTLKGRRHSCATVFSPPNKVDLSKTREKFGSVEEKMLEFQGHKVKRDSLEIRVTDDEDVCVMREVTSVPRFALKEKKMETHAEEDVDERQAGGRKAEGKVEEEEDGHKTPSPSAKGTAKRRSLPQRTLSIQVSGIVASGRRRFESGKAVAEDMPTLAEEIAETANKSNNPATGMSSEERRGFPCVEGFVEEQDEDRGRRGGTQDQEDGPKIAGSNGRELYRAVPASVTVEGEHRVIGKEAVRSEARLSLEKTSPATRGGEGGDDGRSATSRRVSKGKAPSPARQPPPSAASSPDSESEGAAEAKLLGFLSTPAAQARRHSAVDVASLRSFTGGDAAGAPRMRRRGSGDLGSPSRLKEDESKKRFTRARQFFETLERGNDSPPSPPQSAAEVSSSSATPLKAGEGKKKKSSREERTPLGTSSLGRRTGGTKYRPPVPRQAKDSSGSTTDSDKERKHRRKVRRTPSTHSAPGSDVDSSGSTPLNHPSLHRRKRDREFVLRSQRFGGSEREVKVSERFNVMDLFRDVAGPGNGVSSGRATPLGIPHQAAVLAALRSVEDVRNCETTSPYDMYRPVEADNDCEPSASGTNASASASTNASANASANASGAEDEAEGVSGAGGAVSDENANPGGEDEEGNITFGSPMTMCVKKEYQAEYPHLPITSPRHSRHRSPNTDLIPRNVLLQRDANENSPGKASRRSIAELF